METLYVLKVYRDDSMARWDDNSPFPGFRGTDMLRYDYGYIKETQSDGWIVISARYTPGRWVSFSTKFKLLEQRKVKISEWRSFCLMQKEWLVGIEKNQKENGKYQITELRL